MTDEFWLSEALEQLGRHDEAIATFEGAVERWSVGSVPVRAQAAYGSSLAGVQRFDEAEEMLQMAFDDAPTPAVAQRTALRLSALYTAWDKPDQAETWRAQAQQ